MNKKGFLWFGKKKQKDASKAETPTEWAEEKLDEEIIAKESLKKEALAKECKKDWYQSGSTIAAIGRHTLGQDYYWEYPGSDRIRLNQKNIEDLRMKYPSFRPTKENHVIDFIFKTQRRTYTTEERQHTREPHSKIAGDYLGGRTETISYSRESLKGKNMVHVLLIPGYENKKIIWIVMAYSVKNPYPHYATLNSWGEKNQIFEMFVKANGNYYD